MNTPSKKSWAYLLAVVALCFLAFLYLLALRQSPPPPNQPAATVPLAKTPAQREAPAFEPPAESTKEEVARRTDNSTVTNAADLYRQAFALYAALTNDEKSILGDWRTNVDASVEAELCEKIRPICDLMHQASAVTNCDWGIGPITFDTRLQHFPASRKIAQAALWSAAHCRSNDVTGAAVDALSILRLGRSISQTLDMGCLADVMLQRLVSSFVAQNIGMFHGADAQRIAEAFQDPLYEEAPSRAIEQEAELSARYAAKLSVMPPDEAEKETARLVIPIEGEAPGLDRDNVLAALKQINDSQRQLAKALASSSEDEYTTWFHDWTELMHSNPLAPALLGASDLFVEKVRGAKVGRALTVAGLAVAEGAPVTLYTDPSSGQPFIYTKTADGFQLQSAYKFNGKPMTMQFK